MIDSETPKEGDLEKNENEPSVLKDLVARLEKQEAITEVSNLKARYLRMMDKLVLATEAENGAENAANMVELFAEDAVWTGGEFFGYYKGRDAIRGFLEQLAGVAPYTKHVTMNPEFDVQGDTVHALWQLVVLAIDGKTGYGMWKGGFYRDTYKKCADGKWRIAALSVRVEQGYYQKAGGPFTYAGRNFQDGSGTLPTEAH